MLFPNIKNKVLIGAALCLIAGPIAVFLTFSSDPADAQLARLNSKYGLVAVESLDDSPAPRVASLFVSDALRADILDQTDTARQELIVKLTDEESQPAADLQNVLILNLQTDEDIERVAEEYAASEVVQYAEPNFDLEAELSPAVATDLPAETAPSAEVVEPIVVAVLDSGVDLKHPDFTGRVLPGWDFLQDSVQMVDNDGHGTHTTGIILANSTAAQVLPLKISDGSSGKIRELVEAIKYAVDRDAQVINLSLGLKKESRTLREAIDYAQKQGVIVVAAAGNYRSDTEYFPAAWPGVFAVSGLAKSGKKLFLSNFGEWVDFSVVAQDVHAPAPGGAYAFHTGTSQAAPVVSAKIADFLSAAESLDESALEDFLTENSEPISGKYLLGRQVFSASE